MVLSGGGQLTRRQHLLSRDGRLLLVCTSNRIRVYSALTAELLFSLQGHTDEVTSIAAHPKNASQIYSCSIDGTIALWDLQDGTQVQSWPVIGEPIQSLAVVGSTAFISCSWRNAEAGRALAFDLAQGATKEARIKLSKPQAMTTSTSGNLVATHDRHTVLVWSTNAFGTSRPLALRHTKAITCVAVSPNGNRVAAGDVTGRIVIWHDVASEVAARVAAAAADGPATLRAQQDASGALIEDEPEEHAEPPAATVHWHAHAVGCLAFSTDGAYLLSGGNEAVLVIWDTATGRRAYLPRLGGPLVGIVPCPGDAAKYAIRQADNTLRTVNVAAMKVECSVHGLRPLPSTALAPEALPPPLAIQPGTGLAVVAGPHAMLQWYDLLRDAHVDKLQLSQRNFVSLTEADSVAMGGVYGAPAEPAVTAAAFSGDGASLATVESRPDPAGGAMVQYALKFWDRAPAGEEQYGAPYRLNTLADEPHRSSSGFGGVTSLAMHPTMDLAATTSDAGDFKIWTRHHVRTKTNSASASGVDGASRATTWRCAAVGSHRNEPFTASAFSHDGSVLAVGSATGGVTLWDATEVALLATLPPALLHTSTPAGAPSPSAAVRHLLFLSRSPLLVAVFAGGVAVYNTLTLRCEWAIHLDLTAVAADPSSDHWAAVLSGTSNAQHAQQGTGAALERGVVVFKGAEEIPRAAWRARRAGPGTSVVFAPHGTPLHTAAAPVALPGCSPLFIVTSEREYSMGRGQGTTAEALGSAAAAAEGPLASRAQSFGPSAFQGLYGRSAAVEKVGDAAGVAGVADIGGRPAWAALLDAPSHALPAMGTLCPAFLELVALGEPLS